MAVKGNQPQDGACLPHKIHLQSGVLKLSKYIYLSPMKILYNGPEKGWGKTRVLSLAFINVLVRIRGCSFALLLLLLPELCHSQEFEVGLIGSVFWENVIIVFLPSSIRLERKTPQSEFNLHVNIGY